MRKNISIPLEQVYVYRVSSVTEFRAKLEGAVAVRPPVRDSLWDCVDTDVERPPTIREAFAPSV
jgi:hypothetical protein